MITMIGSIKPKRIILRLISILIICVFSLDTVVWTQPKKAGIQTYSAENLQVQSLFSPVINVIGKAYKTQLRVETAMLLAMVLKNKEITYPSLNAEMNKWNEHILREKTKSILRVISNPRQTEKGIAINVEIKQGKQGQKRFTIISMCKNIEDIQKDLKRLCLEWTGI